MLFYQPNLFGSFPPQVLSFGIFTTDDDKDTSSSLKIVLDETGLFQVAYSLKAVRKGH
jgi:hypothetical protein